MQTPEVYRAKRRDRMADPVRRAEKQANQRAWCQAKFKDPAARAARNTKRRAKWALRKTQNAQNRP